MVNKFNNLSKVVRSILLFPIWGWVVSALYRICKYFEYGKEKVLTLVLGILCFIPFVGFVFSVIDIITTISDDKIDVLAE